jgi:hypothetical protein
MAKEIDIYTASLITNLGSNALSLENLNALDAVKLSTRGFIEITNDSLAITSKAKNALRRFEREQKVEEAIDAVRTAVNELLVEPGAVTQHRAVWNKVGGPSKFDREVVLKAMNTLRDQGVINNHQTSGNNFQIYWKRADDIVTAPDFEVNIDNVGESITDEVDNNDAESAEESDE